MSRPRASAVTNWRSLAAWSWLVAGACSAAGFAMSLSSLGPARDSSLFGQHHDLARDLPLRHARHRRRCLGERHAFADPWPYAARGEPVHELAHIARVALRIVLHRVAPVHADERAFLEQRQIERDARNRAGGKTDDQQPPAPP